LTGRTVFVEDEAVVTNEDIQRTAVVPGGAPDTFGVQVEFTAEGARKMLNATGGNPGGLMAILIDGEVVSAPAIRTPVSSVGLISGTYSYAEAERIAEGIRLP
jgi:SecD/SecF fusion protein